MINTKSSQKLQTTQKLVTPVLWTELNDNVAAQLSGGAKLGPLKRGNGEPNPIRLKCSYDNCPL